ncbi:hypothetical protein CRYUN_Cryun31cG0016200 [Craigia yunnanensis]
MKSLVNGLASTSKGEEAKELIQNVKEKFSKNADMWDEIEKAKVSACIFTFRELVVATDNFNPDYLIGEIGFCWVCKGYIDSIDQIVAMKQLNRNGMLGSREFFSEVLMLNGDRRILVYKYTPNGSLENHLLGQERLDWNTRMKVAERAAKGLKYLHDFADPSIIYRDFKASNILLDAYSNPKLSDFELAKLGPTGEKDHESTRVMGMYGYCSPEYAMTRQLITKSDVYSFGVLFLEPISGRRAIDIERPTEEQNLVTWAEPLFKDRQKFTLIADPLLEEKYHVKGLYQALAVAAMCRREGADGH